MTWTVGRLARKHGLSRSALLYYDRLGLLSPAGRDSGEQRMYSQDEAERLERILLYRRAGVRLKDIKAVLDSPGLALSEVLMARLADLDVEAKRLREQQRLIVSLLQDPTLLVGLGLVDRESLAALLAASGMGEEDRLRFHASFEALSPDKHRRFMELLGLSQEEAERVAARSRQALAQGLAPPPAR